MTMDHPNAEAPNKGKRSWHCYVEVGQCYVTFLASKQALKRFLCWMLRRNEEVKTKNIDIKSIFHSCLKQRKGRKSDCSKKCSESSMCTCSS